MGWVGYLPDLQPYYDDSYTRTHFIALLSNIGFLTKANKAIDYFDRWMMYFPNSYPALQIGGKPVPGHATVIANKPHVYFDELSKVGWPEKFKTRDYGNPETDGHGLLMLSRWRAWIKGGRTKAWLEQRWEAVNEAAEWIGWCLDNPQLSFSEHGLLYSESEGGMAMESLYCNVPCYFGLLAYAEMAEALKRQMWRDDGVTKPKDFWTLWMPTFHRSWSRGEMCGIRRKLVDGGWRQLRLRFSKGWSYTAMMRSITCRPVGPNAPSALIPCNPQSANRSFAIPRRWDTGRALSPNPHSCWTGWKMRRT